MLPAFSGRPVVVSLAKPAGGTGAFSGKCQLATWRWLSPGAWGELPRKKKERKHTFKMTRDISGPNPVFLKTLFYKTIRALHTILPGNYWGLLRVSAAHWVCHAVFSEDTHWYCWKMKSGRAQVRESRKTKCPRAGILREDRPSLSAQICLFPRNSWIWHLAETGSHLNYHTYCDSSCVSLSVIIMELFLSGLMSSCLPTVCFGYFFFFQYLLEPVWWEPWSCVP